MKYAKESEETTYLMNFVFQSYLLAKQNILILRQKHITMKIRGLKYFYIVLTTNKLRKDNQEINKKQKVLWKVYYLHTVYYQPTNTKQVGSEF